MSFSDRKSQRVSIDFSDSKVLTEQSHKKACDIHNIMRQYEKTGVVNHVNKYRGQYMDMPTGIDFHTAMQTVATARSMFETVPSKIRAMFKDDPGAFVDFMVDPANYEAIKELGFDTSHLPTPPTPKEGDAPPPAPTPAPA